jgi:flagellar hook-associated protein 3 FlgL
MRVTDLTKQNQVVRNIQTAQQKIQGLQGDISSGKRISKISDDPIGATRAQDFRTSISFMGTLQRNMRDDFVWMDRTEAEIADISDMLRRTKTLILAQANASGDDATRRVTAEELDALLDGMIDAGNSKIGKLYIFSGSKTFTRPLAESPGMQPAIIRVKDPAGDPAVDVDGEALVDDAPPPPPLPEGFDADMAVFEGNSSNTYILKITKAGPLGRAHYQVTDDGGETWSRNQTMLPKNEVFNQDGKATDKVFLQVNPPKPEEGEQEFVFPEGMEFEFKPNPSLAYRGNQDKRMVRTGEGILLPMNLTAEDIFFAKEGDAESVNVFDLMFTLRRALLDNDQVALERRLDDIDLAFEQVLENRASIGAVRKEMEQRMEKLDDRVFSKTSQLSDIEDLDIPKAIVEMNMADTRNRAALNTSARLLEPSLLNFLR